jgi:8-oxo-dGTP pyrophosphatase MutT (NUDIX family)
MPPESETQRKAMFAAAAGRSTLGIPKKVGEEFANADLGGKLPKTAKDMSKEGWKSIFTGLTSLAKFFTEEEREPEHQEASDDKPKGRAASVAFVTPDGQTLLLKRSSKESNFPGHWAWPGGKVEEGEDFLGGAQRECKEEIGDCGFDNIKEFDKKRTKFGWDHVTYLVPVEKPFDPTLNEEHEDYAWCPVTELPKPMHPGVLNTIQKGIGEDSNGKLSESTREEVDSTKHREDMPLSAFLGPHRTYPVKEKRDGEWKYTRALLLAAARRARMQHEEEIAKRADAIRLREFDESEAALDMAMDWAGAVVLRDNSFTPIINMAFDFESVREKGEGGKLGIKVANISKANICPYRGKEIPDWQQLGLDPEKTYMLFRDPEELAKAAPTFNNLPILSTHVPVTSTQFPQDKIIGATGSEAKFGEPYLTNGLSFWRQDAIDDIEGNTKKQLSSGYRYRADMTPGEYKGIHFDGVMRDIKGNHLALVKEGRAGEDVVVGDSALTLTPQERALAVYRDQSDGEDNLDNDDNDFYSSENPDSAQIKALAARKEAEDNNGLVDATGAWDSIGGFKMAKIGPIKARQIVKSLKAKGIMAMDASEEEAVKMLQNENESEDDFDPNSGLPSYMEGEKEDDGEDSYDSTEEMQADQEYDRRCADARARLGRDETEAERMEREDRETAADRRAKLGRDELPEEAIKRAQAMSRDRAYRAARDSHRMGRDRFSSARDSVLTAWDMCKRADDEFSKASEEYEKAKGEKEAADRAHRTEDSVKCMDRMRSADSMRAKAAADRKSAMDRHKSATDSLKSARDSVKSARDARMKARDARRMGRDEFPEKKPVTKEEMQSAMDAAIRSERDRSSKFIAALNAVRPAVGELAMDSATSTADDVFKAGLKILGVDAAGIHPSAYPQMFRMASAAASKRVPGSTHRHYAMDSKNTDGAPSFDEMFPAASRISAV